MRELIILTGPMRSGKTSFCKALFTLLAAKSLQPFAIIEVNQRDSGGIPISLALRDLDAEEEFPLASREAISPGTACQYPPFRFSAEAFFWAHARVKQAAGKGCGPVIIDEIGPLEAKAGNGFLPTVAWILEYCDCPLVVTMRPDLEKAFIGRLAAAQGHDGIETFHVEVGSGEEGLQTVAAEIFRHCQDRKGAL